MSNEINNNEMQQGAVTLLDILGWKGIWQRKSSAIDILMKLIDSMEKKVDTLLKIGNNSFKIDYFKNLKVEVKSISDTIALITYGEADKALEFHAIITSIIISESIEKEIPVRGATSYGYFTCEKNIMVGPAVDEVASWYEATDWIGVIYTPSALFKVNLDKFIFKNYTFLKKHEVLIKGHGKLNTFCINWPFAWNFNNKATNRSDLIDAFLKMGPITPNIAFKFTNTLDFYDREDSNTLNNPVDEAAIAK